MTKLLIYSKKSMYFKKTNFIFHTKFLNINPHFFFLKFKVHTLFPYLKKEVIFRFSKIKKKFKEKTRNNKKPIKHKLINNYQITRTSMDIDINDPAIFRKQVLNVSGPHVRRNI